MDVDPIPSTSKGTGTAKSQRRLSCKHLRALKNAEMLASYEMLHAFYVACIRESAARRKVKDCVCYKCREANSESSETSPEKRNLFRVQAIHACLSCIHFGCFRDNCHIKQHAKEMKHLFAMDIDFGEIYCFKCRDYQYDSDFVKIAESQRAIARSRKNAIKSKIRPVIGNPVKFEPSKELKAILPCHTIVNYAETGIRGLLNLGLYTCYFNVIIQSLLHAPVFRDYLLSSQHKCKRINAKDSKKLPCLICEMTNVIQESFSGNEKPLALVKVLYGFFNRCPHYARIHHNDAYDCFEDLIVNFHQDETGKVHQRGVSLNLEKFSPCDCVIHKIFEFQVQREDTCIHCKKTSKEKELTSSIFLSTILPTPKSTDSKSKVQKFEGVTFIECLESTWILSSKCGECQGLSGHTVNVNPINLPIILCICPNQIYLQSIDPRTTYTKFEKTIDMSPYVLPSSKEKNSILEYMYYLFAVVEFDSGHYRCYIKKDKDKWFKCDDATIEPISIEEVLQISARLLFYHKMFM